MAKKRIMYECMACGYESPKWLGKCPECGAWNQMEEQIVQPTVVQRASIASNRTGDDYYAKKLNEIEYINEARVNTDFSEFDRVLGGGVVTGSLVLIGGDPGIGKSTLLLQVSLQLANKNQKILYVSGEESLSQIKMRAERLSMDSDNFYLYSETDLTVIDRKSTRLNSSH